MCGFEVKIPGIGGWVYRCQGSSCVFNQISSTLGLNTNPGRVGYFNYACQVALEDALFLFHLVTASHSFSHGRLRKFQLNKYRKKVGCCVSSSSTRFYKKLGFLARESQIGRFFLAVLKNIDFFSKPTTRKESTRPDYTFKHINRGGSEEKFGQNRQRN